MSLRKHQIEGARRIVEQRALWLGDEMGVGKTRQVVEAAQRLWEMHQIDVVLVIAPAAVAESVWFDRDFGQIAAGTRVPTAVTLYRPKPRTWVEGEEGTRSLLWFVTNYEFARSARRFGPLLELASRRTLLVLDESLAVKTVKTETAKACLKLRKKCGRVVILNGTEGGGDTPADVYGQARMLSPSVLGCRHKQEFMARYAVMDSHGFHVRRRPVTVARWINLDDLWRRMDSYYLRRTKAECLDLPPKLPPVTLAVALSKDTWKAYREMRSDAVAWLKKNEVATAQQAGVRAMRLAQLASGFVGGIETLDEAGETVGRLEEPRVISHEKLHALLDWARRVLEEERSAKFVVWCRFRVEAAQAAESLSLLLTTGLLIGGQQREERFASLALLDPVSAPSGAACVVGTVRTGYLGVNLQAADKVAYLSNDHSFVTRSQSEDRCHRVGQHRPVSYFDFVATGPNGQKTVDHAVIEALRGKKSVASWRAAEWLTALEKE